MNNEFHFTKGRQENASKIPTEPVDRVYAMLGILSDDIRWQIIVDYSAKNRKDYWRTYVQLFKALLRRHGTLYLLPVSAAAPSAKLPERYDLHVVGTGARLVPEGHVQHTETRNAGQYLLSI